MRYLQSNFIYLGSSHSRTQQRANSLFSQTLSGIKSFSRKQQEKSIRYSGACTKYEIHCAKSGSRGKSGYFSRSDSFDW